jgi:hypothetical protein
MSAAFRQKLLNWTCSVMGLLLYCTILLIQLWLAVTNSHNADLNMIPDWPPILIPAMEAYIFGFTLIAFWHLFDFIQISKKGKGALEFFSSYGVWINSLAAIALVQICKYSGLIETHLCIWCNPSFPPWISLLFLLLLLIVIILCMAKAVIAIRSRIQKVP